MTESWERLAHARRMFADAVGGLSDDQHDAATLCDAWSVRHVVAHVASFIERTPEEFGADFARAGSITGAMDLGVESRVDRPVDELLDVIRNSASQPANPPATEDGMIADTLIHLQDIRRPLGLGTDLPEDDLRTMLEFITKHDNAEMVAGSVSRVQDLELVATDLDWTTGEGQRVEGPAEALALAASGRSAALADLAGDGVDRLADRMPS